MTVTPILLAYSTKTSPYLKTGYIMKRVETGEEVKERAVTVIALDATRAAMQELVSERVPIEVETTMGKDWSGTPVG